MNYKFITSLFLAILMLSSCDNPNFHPGEIYSIEDGDGAFGVVKILVIEPSTIHIKIYKNKYNIRPEKIDLSELSLGRIDDESGFGIGHVPLDLNGFIKWKPILIANEEVSEDELFGYNIWKEGN